MSTSAVVIALAGGAGAAVGGAIAQGAGFFIEAYKVRRAAEVRRKELRAELRREQRMKTEALQRDLRQARVDAYKKAAAGLERLLYSTNWFMYRIDENEEHARPITGKLAEGAFESFWKTVHAEVKSIRELTLSLGSEEVAELRRLLFVVRTTVREWHFAYTLSPDEQEVRIYHLDVVDGALHSQFEDMPSDNAKVLRLAMRDCETLRSICVWGLDQIRWELTGERRPSALPFRAAALDTKLLDF